MGHMPLLTEEPAHSSSSHEAAMAENGKSSENPDSSDSDSGKIIIIIK